MPFYCLDFDLVSSGQHARELLVGEEHRAALLLVKQRARTGP
jgi:hypothetical protein